jgi:hypothetical protein
MFGLAAFVRRLAHHRAATEKKNHEHTTRAFAALKREERLMALTEPNQVAQWTCGDGSRVEVGAMRDSHLFYALAKAGRGEYPDSHARQVGVRALELEALRRLRNKMLHGPVQLSSFASPTVDRAALRHMHNYDNR